MKRTSSGKIYHNNRIIDFVLDIRQMLECKMTSGEDKKVSPLKCWRSQGEEERPGGRGVSVKHISPH